MGPFQPMLAHIFGGGQCQQRAGGIFRFAQSGHRPQQVGVVQFAGAVRVPQHGAHQLGQCLARKWFKLKRRDGVRRRFCIVVRPPVRGPGVSSQGFHPRGQHSLHPVAHAGALKQQHPHRMRQLRAAPRQSAQQFTHLFGPLRRIVHHHEQRLRRSCRRLPPQRFQKGVHIVRSEKTGVPMRPHGASYVQTQLIGQARLAAARRGGDQQPAEGAAGIGHAGLAEKMLEPIHVPLAAEKGIGSGGIAQAGDDTTLARAFRQLQQVGPQQLMLRSLFLQPLTHAVDGAPQLIQPPPRIGKTFQHALRRQQLQTGGIRKYMRVGKCRAESVLQILSRIGPDIEMGDDLKRLPQDGQTRHPLIQPRQRSISCRFSAPSHQLEKDFHHSGADELRPTGGFMQRINQNRLQSFISIGQPRKQDHD